MTMEHNLPPFFFEIFSPSLPRLGPGSPQTTRKALSIVQPFLNELDKGGREKLNVLDFGCGNGPQTIELAQQLNANFLVVDNHQAYLDELFRRAQTRQIADRIETCCADMGTLKLEQNSFDLIWSEGSLSIALGSIEGLKTLHPLLKNGGVCAFSDLVWLKDNPPEECSQFFAQDCIFMKDLDTSLKLIDECGFRTIEHFTLPESAWLVDFYAPLEERITQLRHLFPNDVEKIALLDGIQAEIDIYRKYSEYYGYEFFVLQKR